MIYVSNQFTLLITFAKFYILKMFFFTLLFSLLKIHTQYLDNIMCYVVK